MVSISNNIVVCILCLACSGCQKKDISRICKEVQASSSTDETYISLFDDDLHEFASANEAVSECNVQEQHVLIADEKGSDEK